MAAVLFTGALGTVSNALAADRPLVKEDLASDDYCHMKFLSLKGESIPGEPQQVIDFYGTCAEKPRGAEQVEDQRNQFPNMWTANFDD
jgi:hypothetical protein